VTVTHPDGRRRSVDLLADSTYDAAHLYIVEAKEERSVGFPSLSLETTFEVIVDGRIYYVPGAKLQQWITKRRSRWNGPKGYLFSKRPTLELRWSADDRCRS
jgi:hypothetical protein